ncbi:MAG: hypothetical protein AVDCRST_MAG93-2768, partial [uncultured Chloroflexia bacterium]
DHHGAQRQTSRGSSRIMAVALHRRTLSTCANRWLRLVNGLCL